MNNNKVMQIIQVETAIVTPRKIRKLFLVVFLVILQFLNSNLNVVLYNRDVSFNDISGNVPANFAKTGFSM